MRRDIDDALNGWPYEPELDEIAAREIKARDGRTVLQIRIELGILQLEVSGRPDGARPHGFASYLDYLRHRAASRAQVPGGKAASWVMSDDHYGPTDREFAQFRHRRIAWLALERYEKALLDADHTLALMDFVRRHAESEDYVATHERARGAVTYQRTQAATALAVERRRPEEAIDIIRDAIERLKAHQREWESKDEMSDSSHQSMIDQLHLLADEIRKNFAVDKTLKEQLDEAVAREDYERAARIRDMMRGRR